jgi:phenylalanyl-tRNA synthetase alpha chain
MDIETINTQLDSQIGKIDSPQALEELRLQYLGRKGILAQLTAALADLPVEQRARYGQQVNALKLKITTLIEEKKRNITSLHPSASALSCDIDMPAISQELGRLHPVTQTINEICAVFTQMGFSVVEGPEIETEFNNFTALNIPLEHPSRDAFDTFYIKPQASGRKPAACSQRLLLRSHTSPVQIRVMQSRKPPLAVIVPGRVYRPDAVDASHSFMFHQVEGFMVDTGIRFSDLKGTLEVFAKEIFGKEIKMRFRPHFFPFTEPSAEVDVACITCKREQGTPRLHPSTSSGLRSGQAENSPPRQVQTAGRGEQKQHCSVCGDKGWLEILGSGMIHPNVFKQVGYDPKKFTGFAFGMGVERIAMLKYGIDDIRLFFENDLRFLKQF